MREAELLSRRRIVERLSAQVDGGVSLVHAEAGSGKSTLLSLLAEASRVPVVRVALEPSAEDAVVLLRAVRDALDLELSDEILTRAPPGEVGARLRRAMVARAPLVLALDDAHHLSDSPPALEAAAALAEDLPERVGLVLASRGPVRLPLSRLRAQGRLEEVTADDLALSVDEVAELVARVAPDARLAPDDVARIHAATSGWLVAALLLARSLRSAPAARVLAGLDAADQPLGDYLTEAVLSNLPAETVGLLEQAAALEPFDRALLKEATGADPDEAIHAALREHLLIDEGGGRFVFAARIGEIMRRRLAARADVHAGIHRRAARVHVDREDLDRAIHHHLEAGDEDAASSLLVTVGYASLSNNRIRSLGRYLERLSPARVEAMPLLRFARATVWMMRGETERVAPEFEAVAEGAGPPPLIAAACSRLAYLCTWQGRFTDAARFAARARELAPPLPDAISVYAHALLASALRHLGRDAEAEPLERALAASEVPYPSDAIAPFNEGLVRRLQGRHEEERRLALEWIEREERSPFRVSLPSFVMLAAGAAVSLGDFREGLQRAEEGIALAVSSDAPWWAAPCRLSRAESLAGLGRRDEALEEAERALAACGAGAMHWTAAETSLLCAALEDDPAPWLERAWRSAERTQHPALRARVGAARARSALDVGDPLAAQEALAMARRELGDVGAGELRRSLALLEGRCAHLEGRKAEAGRGIAAELVEGPALRAERRGLVPALLDLAVAGSAEARAELRAAGTDALARLARSRAKVAGLLAEEILEDEAGPLEVESLGGLRILRHHRTRDRVAEVRLRTPKVAELLWLLLLGRGRPVSRDSLLEALWSGEAGEAAGNRLHVHLSHLRHGLEPHLPRRARSRYVVREPGGYALDLRGGSVDAFLFETDARAGLTAVRGGDAERGEAFLTAALVRYGGPLWSDRAVPERLEAERARLEELSVEATLAAARQARGRGDFSTATERLEALIARRPAEEAAYRALMELAADRGRAGQIESILARCRQALASLLDVVPEPETEALAERLRSSLVRAGN